MEHFASEIKIQNFKSIKEIEIKNCKRINLFIGKPNVGKSNILEAMSLFSLPTMLLYNEISLDLHDLIRFKNTAELFFNGDSLYPLFLYIKSKKGILYNTTLTNQTKRISFTYKDKDILMSNLDIEYSENEKDFHIFRDTSSYDRFENIIKSYLFIQKRDSKDYFKEDYLIPPHGENLYSVIQDDKALKKEFLSLFRTYGLHLVFDKSSQELKIMKGVENGEIFLIPFSSVADSLQRLIFYKTAIKSNQNSVITFEEPEAHTYPPYIAQIARDIIDAKTNQFFITTHSPYVVNELLENAQDELAIYMVDFKEGQTMVRRLTDNELDEVYNDGIDLFFNNEFFL